MTDIYCVECRKCSKAERGKSATWNLTNQELDCWYFLFPSLVFRKGHLQGHRCNLSISCSRARRCCLFSRMSVWLPCVLFYFSAGSSPAASPLNYGFSRHSILNPSIFSFHMPSECSHSCPKLQLALFGDSPKVCSSWGLDALPLRCSTKYACLKLNSSHLSQQPCIFVASRTHQETGRRHWLLPFLSTPWSSMRHANCFQFFRSRNT